MTVRLNKQFIVAAGALILGLLTVEVILTFLAGRGLHEMVKFATQAFVVMLLAINWRRLSLLEAEHGPDYEQPGTRRAGLTALAIAAAVAVAVAAGVAAYALITRR